MQFKHLWVNRDRLGLESRLLCVTTDSKFVIALGVAVPRFRYALDFDYQLVWLFRRNVDPYSGCRIGCVLRINNAKGRWFVIRNVLRLHELNHDAVVWPRHGTVPLLIRRQYEAAVEFDRRGRLNAVQFRLRLDRPDFHRGTIRKNHFSSRWVSRRAAITTANAQRTHQSKYR